MIHRLRLQLSAIKISPIKSIVSVFIFVDKMECPFGWYRRLCKRRLFNLREINYFIQELFYFLFAFQTRIEQHCQLIRFAENFAFTIVLHFSHFHNEPNLDHNHRCKQRIENLTDCGSLINWCFSNVDRNATQIQNNRKYYGCNGTTIYSAI